MRPRAAPLLAISRMIVDGARPNRPAIERIDSPCAVPIMICSRSPADSRGRVCPSGGNHRGFTPPNLRNHLLPHVCDTPTATPASSEDTPAATNSQYRRCTNND
jgi:hypothetical protein